jgi:hypothetical protein
MPYLTLWNHRIDILSQVSQSHGLREFCGHHVWEAEQCLSFTDLFGTSLRCYSRQGITTMDSQYRVITTKAQPHLFNSYEPSFSLRTGEKHRF